MLSADLVRSESRRALRCRCQRTRPRQPTLVEEPTGYWRLSRSRHPGFVNRSAISRVISPSETRPYPESGFSCSANQDSTVARDTDSERSGGPKNRCESRFWSKHTAPIMGASGSLTPASTSRNRSSACRLAFFRFLESKINPLCFQTLPEAHESFTGESSDHAPLPSTFLRPGLCAPPWKCTA